MRNDLKRRCNAIEEAYEFMLAYAAQGTTGEADNQAVGELRRMVTRALDALSGLAELVTDIVRNDRLEPAEKYRTLATVLARDAETMATILQLVMGQTSISSQLIDNVNASIHVRALLTDLFIIDEILRPQAAAPRSVGS